MQHWNDEWKKAELDFVNLLNDNGMRGGKLAEKLEDQYKDIDVLFDYGKRQWSVSIKDQGNVETYKSFLFEYLLVNTDDNSNMLGSVLTNRSDYYAIRYQLGEDYYFSLVDSSKLKEALLYTRRESIPLQKWKRIANRNKLHRKYNHTLCWRFMLDEWEELKPATFKKVSNKWTLQK